MLIIILETITNEIRFLFPDALTGFLEDVRRQFFELFYSRLDDQQRQFRK